MREIVAILVSGLIISIVIVFCSQKIESSILKHGSDSIRHAYMCGISAKPMQLPADIYADREYILRSFETAEGGTVSQIYEGAWSCEK